MSTDAAMSAATSDPAAPAAAEAAAPDATRWVMLNDLTGSHATAMNAATGEVRSIVASGIVGGGVLGLRRTVLKEQPNGKFVETGEQVPLTAALYDDLVDAYHSPNSWNYDWPHFQVEAVATPADRARVKAALEGQMAKHPYEFEIIGLQRRYLMYFSDGDWRSQAQFVALAPQPDRYPYRFVDGELRRRYTGTYSAILRDAGAPFPEDWQRYAGPLRPMLYRGPAWVVRFRVDSQDVAFGHCRVYVTDDAEFICSDWCQRDSLARYEGGGISLQTQQYTFDGWVVGPCLKHASQKNGFKPKAVTYASDRVKDLLKKEPKPVTEFATALERAEAALKARKSGQVATPGQPAPPSYLARVVGAFDHNPHRSNLEVAWAVADELLAAVAEKKTNTTGLNGLLIGLPVDAAASQFTKAQQETLTAAALKTPEGRFRLRVEPKTCSATSAAQYPTLPYACLRHEPGGSQYHWHLNLAHVALDRDAVADALFPAVVAERARRDTQAVADSGVDAGPITGAALAEASEIMQTLIDTRRTLRKADLAAKALTHAQRFLDAPVQHVFDHEGWLFRFLEQTDGTADAEYVIGTSGPWNKLGRVKRGKSGHVYVRYPGHDDYFRFDPGRQKDATMRFFKEFAGNRPYADDGGETAGGEAAATLEDAFII